MNPNILNPHPDANSSSLAYLDYLPPGTNPAETPDPALTPPPAAPQLRNRAHPPRPPLSPKQDLMDVDTGTDTSRSSHETSSDHAPEHIPKRARSDTNDSATLEHSEPVCKQRRTDSLEPAASVVGLSPEAIQSALLEAVSQGRLDRVQSLMNQTDNIDTIFDGNLWNLAARHGHLAIIDWLSTQVYRFDLPEPDYGKLFETAVDCGQINVLQWLDRKRLVFPGTDVDYDDALIRAASGGHLNVVQWLAGQGCDTQAVNTNEDNALTVAASGGHLEIVQWLAGQGYDIHQVNRNDENALTLAAYGGHLETVQWLAGQGCNIHQVTKYNGNALNLAASGGHLEVVKWLIEKGVDMNVVDFQGYTALADSIKLWDSAVACHLIMQGASLKLGNDVDWAFYLFRALERGDTVLSNLLIPRQDVSNREFLDRTPLMLAAEKRLIEVAVPLILATLRLPDGRALVQEAYQIDTDPLFKELLKNPFIIENNPTLYSQLSPEGEPTIESSVVHDYFVSQCDVLESLENQLGSAESMTLMQKASAKAGILANLPAWKHVNRIDKIFDKKLPSFLLPIQKKVATFISEDIEVLATQANGWEDTYLVPVIENLYPSCLMHSFSARPAMDITRALTDKGLYHPIARRIASAWTTAWAAMSEEAKPVLRSMSTAQPDDRDVKYLPDPEILNGEVAIRADTLTPEFDNFVATPAGVRLLQAFRVALKDELDAVESRILYAEDESLEPESDDLYADLMMRQLHLIAQFWRAEPS